MLEDLWNKARGTVDKGDTLAEIYAVLNDVITVPEVRKQVQQAIMWKALLALAQAKLSAKKQQFSPANADAHDL